MLDARAATQSGQGFDGQQSGSTERLRILMVCPTPWRDDFGLPKVQMQLADELRLRGHTVQKFSLEDAAAHQPHRLLADLTPWFATAVHRHVRENAAKYDVIDAHQGTVRAPKSTLGFHGSIVIRSAGLHHFYAAFHSWADPHRRPGAWHWVGRRREAVAREIGRHNAERSFDIADRIIVHNQAELDFLSLNPDWLPKARMVPAPISEGAFTNLSAVAGSPSREDVRGPAVSVVGTWDARKGSRDWPRLASLLVSASPSVELRFLGTSVSKQDAPAVERALWVPRYRPDQLPDFLRGTQVGAFPSYLEGWPIAVVEQLAAGIPVIAYDIPGPRDILQPVDPFLLVRLGDVEGMSQRIVDLLSASPSRLVTLRARCVARAEQLTWSKWVDPMLTYYGEVAPVVQKDASPNSSS
jgi:glycosyltransferase involved in cell wall biosynthesis